MKRFFLKFMRLFTYYGQQQHNPGILHILIVASGIGVCLFLVLLMVWKIDKKFVFFLDEIVMPQASSVTIGDNSDFCYKNIPQDFMTVTYEDGAYHWKVSQTKKDSLQYFKVNDRNPNKVSVMNSADQKIVVKSADVSIELTGKDIYKEWKNYPDQQDVLLRHFLAEYACERLRTPEDSVLYLGQMTQKNLRSFLHNEKGSISLVVLDAYTTVDGIGYQYEGTVPSAAEDGCKIQFFGITDYSYWTRSSNSNFKINGINHAMKAGVKLTDWGAGHIMIRHLPENGFCLSFPKGLGYVGSVDSLRAKAEKTSNHITFKQLSNTFPSAGDLYLPQISRNVNQDLFSLEMRENNDSLFYRDNLNLSHAVQNSKTWKLGFSLIPAFSKVTLSDGRNKLHCRMGLINTSFVLSYFWLPGIVLLVFLFLILAPRSLSPVRKHLNYPDFDIYKEPQIMHYPIYFSLLLCIAAVYMICKSLIALKLSYSFPYFEKITGIIPLSTSLTLILFFSLAMVLNHSMLLGCDKNDLKIGYKRWGSLLVTILLFVGIVWGGFKLLDGQVNYGVIASYFPSEIYSMKVWNWMGNFALNDNHRTVPYMLVVIITLVLIAWTFLNVFSLKFEEKLAIQEDNLRNLDHKWTAFLNEKWETMTRPLASKINSAVQKDYPVVIRKAIDFSFNLYQILVLSIKVLFPWHFVIMLLLIFFGASLGNCGTAFITFGVIFGLCKALTSAQISNEEKGDVEVSIPQRYMVLGVMLIVSVAYIVVSMIADHGYLTNYLGFFMAVICFYFIYDRSSWDMLMDYHAKREKWVNAIFAFVVFCFILFLPKLASSLSHPDDIDYDRLSRRLSMYSDFEKQQSGGFRYSESDAEFMVVMSHYMQHPDGGDPLSNDHHFLHASVSTGQSPVVLNDLSLPVAFIGSYGVTKATLMFFLLLFLLTVTVIPYSFGYSQNVIQSVLTRAMQWRLLALFMWLGTSVYIYFSYLAFLPFTGRLNPGFGVDAVGEALETAVLLAFMAAVTFKSPENK